MFRVKSFFPVVIAKLPILKSISLKKMDEKEGGFNSNTSLSGGSQASVAERLLTPRALKFTGQPGTSETHQQRSTVTNL